MKPNNLISDLHIHCGLKAYAASMVESEDQNTIWDFFPPQQEAIDQLNFVLKGAIKELAKSSQANLEACAAAKLHAPFLAIYPVERQMFALDPQKPFKNLFKLLLSGKQHAHLAAAVAGFPPERVKAILARINNGKDIGVDYYEQFRKERDYMRGQVGTTSNNKKFQDHQFMIATDYDQFDEALETGNTISGIFTVEGAHAFGHYLHNSTFKKVYHELNMQERQTLETSFMKNVTEVKTEEDGKYAPFFVTFCHHFNNLLAGHARSFSDKSKLFLGFNQPGMRHLFNQETGLNDGFSTLGRKVLNLFLDRQSGRRILIDTKHMSVATREEFYQIIRRKREEENDHIPIIHSHGAISGWLNLDIAKRKEENAALDEGQFFSRWRINLTNEDILETHDSDGIIGVVLHEGRMPGEGFKKVAKKLKKKIKKAKTGSAKKARLQSELKDMYIKLVWSNIFHIIKVVKENRSENGWKMIALGSDYDGLIDPMDAFPEVTNFQDLQQDLIEYLQAGKEIFFSQNGEAHAIPATEVRDLMFGQSEEEILNNILFGNTDRFLSKYFTEAYLGQEVSTDDEEIVIAA